MRGLFSCHATRVHGGGYVWVCTKHLHLGAGHCFVPVQASLWESWHLPARAHR